MSQRTAELSAPSKNTSYRTTWIKRIEAQWDKIHYTSAPGQHQQPTRRSGHTIIVRNDKLYLFGGEDLNRDIYNDLFEFDLFNFTWRRLTVKNNHNRPSHRDGHSAVYYPKLDVMIIFGGQSEKYCNDTHVLDFKSSCWRPINAFGDVPCGRYYHSGVLHGDSMIVFGGEKRMDTYLNDLYILDLKDYCWTRIDSNEQDIPGKRYNHSACIYDSKMFIFGGYGGKVRYNDLWQFDINTKVWKLVDCCGEIPGEMSGHSANVIGDEMFIFGGGRNHVYYSKLYRYNFHTREFQIVESRGDIPEPRGYHKMVVYKGDLYLFGGDSKLKYFDDMFRVRTFENLVGRNLMSKLNGEIFHDVIFK